MGVGTKVLNRFEKTLNKMGAFLIIKTIIKQQKENNLYMGVSIDKIKEFKKIQKRDNVAFLSLVGKYIKEKKERALKSKIREEKEQLKEKYQRVENVVELIKKLELYIWRNYNETPAIFPQDLIGVDSYIHQGEKIMFKDL